MLRHLPGETQKTEYDLDTSGGNMEKIHQLVAPPLSDEALRRLKEQDRKPHRYRPGRVTNHEFCDFCGEGGDLLCCDRCPASFHLECHEPALEEDDLPKGEWVCRRCQQVPIISAKSDFTLRKTATSTGMDSNPSSSGTSEDKSKGLLSTSPKDASSHLDTAPFYSHSASRGLKRQCALKLDKLDDSEVMSYINPSIREGIMPKDRPYLCGDNVQVFDYFGKKKFLDRRDKGLEDTAGTALDILCWASQSLNGQEFKLPPTYNINVVLPGESKVRVESLSMEKKIKAEMNSLPVQAPLRRRLCFKCGRSCTRTSLVKCDYCPLVYHLDCLDPPLTTIPLTQWMCPHHCEHYIDEKLLLSTNKTERVLLHNQSKINPLDARTVMLKFIRKVHTPRPHRIKRVHQQFRTTLQVPRAVKDMYHEPASMTPCAPSALLRKVVDGFSSEMQDDVAESPSPVPPQSSFIKFDFAATKKSSWHEKPSAAVAPTLHAVSTSQSEAALAKRGSATDHERTAAVASPSTLPNGGLAAREEEEDWSIDKHSKTASDQHQLLHTTDVILRASQVAESLPTGTERSLEGAGLIPTSEAQSLLASPVEGRFALLDLDLSKLASTPAMVNVRNVLNASMKEQDLMEARLTSVDMKLIHILAWQRIQQLFPQQNSQQSPLNTAAAELSAVVGGTVRARALLYPMAQIGEPYSITTREVFIGIGSDNHFDLSTLGHCNNLDSPHACIFYDEHARHYELLNYSSHGTEVDRINYGFELMQSDEPPGKKLKSKNQSHPKSKRGSPIKIPEKEPRMNGDSGKRIIPCSCLECLPKPSGWEGPAILRHNSMIKLGCISLLFCVVEPAVVTPQLQLSPQVKLPT